MGPKEKVMSIMITIMAIMLICLASRTTVVEALPCVEHGNKYWMLRKWMVYVRDPAVKTNNSLCVKGFLPKIQRDCILAIRRSVRICADQNRKVSFLKAISEKCVCVFKSKRAHKAIRSAKRKTLRLSRMTAVRVPKCKVIQISNYIKKPAERILVSHKRTELKFHGRRCSGWILYGHTVEGMKELAERRDEEAEAIRQELIYKGIIVEMVA